MPIVNSIPVNTLMQSDTIPRPTDDKDDDLETNSDGSPLVTPLPLPDESPELVSPPDPNISKEDLANFSSPNKQPSDSTADDASSVNII